MHAIVNTGPGRMEWLEVPSPMPGPGQVRVRVDAVGICATDLLMIAGWDRTGFPSIPGHEWCGTVDMAGDCVSESLVGWRCVAENVLSDGAEVGFEHPGGYGQYLVTEADRVQILPQGCPSWQGVLIEPLAVCVRALRRLRPVEQGPTLILGDGPIGLILTMVLAGTPAGPITLVGGRGSRLALATSVGAAHTVNYHDADGDLWGLAENRFAAVIEATGSGDAAQAALRLVSKAGRVLILGDYADARASFRWLDLLHKEMEIVGSNASADAWPEAVRLATEGRLALDRLVTHRLPAGRFAEGLAIVRDRDAGAVKVVLEWDGID